MPVNLIAGLYKINVIYDISQSSTSNTTTTRLNINNIQETENLHSFTRSRQLTKSTSFLYKTFTAGSHVISLDYKVSNGDSTITNIILDITPAT
jgi:hypothetical protein